MSQQPCCATKTSSSSTGLHLETDGGCATPPPRQAHRGDVCTIELDLQANNGFVPEPLFDSSGRISFVLDHGNYLPAIHEIVRNVDMQRQQVVVEIDAGYGAYRKDLLLTVPIKKMERFLLKGQELCVGTTILLPNAVPVIVSSIQNDMVTLDANVPLAGSSYKCTLRLMSIESSPWSSRPPTTTPFQVATLALGCFWGAELFCMRIPGVVGTTVGYAGNNNEVVRVMWDTTLSYRSLLMHALSRAKEVNESVMVGGWLYDTHDDSAADDERYRHGIYFHNEEQRLIAEELLQSEQHLGRMMLNPLSSSFRLAEDDQQQYLYKRGQNAKKGAKDTIRCFG